MTCNEKIETIKKFLSSDVYEDKLIGVEMIDENVTNNVSRLDVTEWSGYHYLDNIQKGDSDLWNLIYLKYHPGTKFLKK